MRSNASQLSHTWVCAALLVNLTCFLFPSLPLSHPTSHPRLPPRNYSLCAWVPLGTVAHTHTEQRIWYLTDRLVGCGDSFGGAAREKESNQSPSNCSSTQNYRLTARTCLGALSLCMCVWHTRININLITSISQLKTLCKAHKPTDLHRGRERGKGKGD